jgi:hypothetical protein
VAILGEVGALLVNKNAIDGGFGIVRNGYVQVTPNILKTSNFEILKRQSLCHCPFARSNDAIHPMEFPCRTLKCDCGDQADCVHPPKTIRGLIFRRSEDVS